MNKSGLPPQQRPIVRAMIPGGAGTVEPKKPKPFLKLGSTTQLESMPKFALGGLASLESHGGLSTSSIPKPPKPPKPGGPKIRIV